MKHRSLGKFLVVAASISMAMTPITALAVETGTGSEATSGEATVDTKALLNDAIKYAEEAKNAASYANVVKTVKDNLEAKLTAAKTVAGKADATTTEINAAWSDLVDAVHYLDFVGDHTALDKAITDAKAEVTKEEDYKAGWAAYADALKNAEDVNADEDALQDEIDAAKTALKTAVAGLVKKDETPVTVNKEALGKAIDHKDELTEADYTPDSWKTYSDAVAAGKAVYDNAEATQAEVDAALSAINNAESKLQTADVDNPVDKTELENAVKANKDLAETTPEGDDTLNPETYGVFTEAYKAAKAVLDNEDATQDEVDKAVKDLKDAYADLDQVMYRAYNPNNGEHLFTANKKEYDFLSANGWNAEGEAWIAPKGDLPGATKMTRMYDENSGEHHYTKNPKEIEFLEKSGWKNEGEKWATAAENEHVIHRLYNPNETRAGRHHYTLADKEKDFLANNGWNWEHNEGDLIYAKAPAPEKK